MATMIPSGVDRFQTEGERTTYRFLEQAAKPDAQYLVWYTPEVGDMEPDFVLFTPSVGLVVLEVKDWAIGQIRAADPAMITLEAAGAIERRTNPIKQAKGYSLQLRDHLKSDRRLVSPDPLHHGNIRIPVGYGVVFANITSDEFKEAGLDKVFREDAIYFWDDLHPASPLRNDESGQAFRADLEDRSPPYFRPNIRARDFAVLRTLLFPEVRIQTPERPPHRDGYEAQKSHVRVLDVHQEFLAKKWSGGHRILQGPAGCGKTLVLVHKAAFLHEHVPGIQKVLLVCFNISLVNYLRRLLAATRVPLGEEAVLVTHIFDLCGKVLGEDIRYEGEDQEYYDTVVSMAAECAPDCGLHFDAILVDEGQDFSDEMFNVVTSLLDPATDNLTIAVDAAQDVYRPKTGWRSLGVEARGRVHRLDAVYRSTCELSDFAARFASPGAGQDDNWGGERQLRMFPDELALHGPPPVLLERAGLQEIARELPELIEQVRSEYGYALSEIAILYPRTSPSRAPEMDIPILIKASLSRGGLMWRWASESSQSKSTYDITTDSITISTAHSVKGMDFACVILVGFDHLAEGRWSEQQLRSIAYVALTRARYSLIIPYSRKGCVVNWMLEALAEA